MIRSNGGQLDEASAVQAAKVLVDRSFEFYEAQDRVVPIYIDYRSASWNDWPKDVVFTTIVMPPAATYGDRIVVLRDYDRRGVDLNYWNKRNNDVWFDHARDVGEFSYPGYVKPGNIVGYEIRSGSSKAWHTVEWAFYRILVKGRPHVLVIDPTRANGKLSHCLYVDAEAKVFSHCDYQPGEHQMEPTKPDGEPVAVLGVLTLCRDLKSCGLTGEVLKGLRTSARLPDNALLKQIQSLDIKNQRPFLVGAAAIKDNL